MIFLYVLYVAAKFAYNTQIQLGGGPKYTRGGGGRGVEPTRTYTPPHSHTPPPPNPHPRGGELRGGGGTRMLKQYIQ